jgi:glutamine synthetase
VRVPARRGQGTSLEFRSPDPACNPYLAFAANLKAGLDGIKNGINPPASVDQNIFEMSEQELQSRGIGCLPGTLGDALEELKKDSLIQEALGPHIFEKFVAAKTLEWNEYRIQVHPWEQEMYLNKY